METNPNLLLAWLGLLGGFVSGMVLGMFFHRENWLGGYGSFPRRMYRLGHISFFGLGVVNFIFAMTEQTFHFTGAVPGFASWAFIIGAITLPLCCGVMAHFPKARLLFAVPVVSLILGGALTLTLILHAPKTAGPADTLSRSAAPPPLSLVAK